jgi:hypothetical protein
MPKYFFNIHSGTEKAGDPEGQCLSDLDAAREEAIAGARDIAADCVRFGKSLDLDQCIEVVDVDGKTLLTVTFRDALVLKA